METIQLKAELLFELENKQQWINRVPQILPKKTRGGEQWVWVDKKGCVFECGADFSAAERLETYPCKVYRLCSVALAEEIKKVNTNQITLSDALKLIDSKEVNSFEIHYRVLINGHKWNIYYSDCLDDNPNLTVEQFIKEADNYGSFWLNINNKGNLLQIVSDETHEPL